MEQGKAICEITPSSGRSNLNNLNVRVHRMKTENQSKTLPALNTAAKFCKKNTLLAGTTNKKTIETGKEEICLIPKMCDSVKLKKFKVRVHRLKMENLRNQSKRLPVMDSAVNFCQKNTVLAATTNKKIMETGKKSICKITTRSAKSSRNQSKPLPALDSAVNFCQKNTVLGATTNKNLMETRKEAACGITTRSGRQIKQSKYNEMEYVITTKQRNNLKKLSLSRASLRTSTPAEIQHIHFEPKNSPKNLANKANAIEQILFYDDEQLEVEKPKTMEEEPEKKDPECTSKVENKSKRFFHKNDIEFKKPTLRQTKNHIKKQYSTAHHKSSVGKIYEFQSSQSDSDSVNKGDPAADIIKKLIDEGRVRVAKSRKGISRPKLKRELWASVKRNKKPLNKKKKEQKVQRKPIFIEGNIPAQVDENNEDNFHDHDVELHEPMDIGEEDIVEIVPSGVERVARQNNKQSINGTFSSLARSVLLNQTEKNDSAHKRIINQRKLLEVARKFVSTPLNRKLSSPMHLSNLSSISITQTGIDKQLGNYSPWRVDEDAHLPSVFHFSQNSSHLPSFSSDYIPSTPQKNKYKYHMLDAPLSPLDNSTSEIQQKSVSPISSFSSNDSNAENLSPPLSAATALNSDVDGNVDINADVFNLRQNPNPRRTYNRRSPLKAINILAVTKLPPWKKPENLINKNAIQKANDNKSNTEKNVKSNKIDLFGFEEFIDDSDTEDRTLAEQTDTKTHHNSNNLGNQSLHDKLHNLKKWRPDIVSEINKEQQSKPISRVFDNDAGRLKERSIKKMLCSTMINPAPSSRSTVVQNFDSDDNDSDEQNENREKKRSDTIDTDLFKDPDPQLSFDDKNPHRTYVRPYKKLRKLRHNFVMFMDSDDSGEENESDEENCNRDHEYSVQKKTEHITKRKNKIENPQPELDSFVENFNRMSKEVEQYELIIE